MKYRLFILSGRNFGVSLEESGFICFVLVFGVGLCHRWLLLLLGY